MSKYHPLVILGFILGISFLLAVAISLFTVWRLRSLNDTITVTGSAKMEVASDKVKWMTQVSRTVKESNLKDGYAQIAADSKKVKSFLISQNINENELTISPIAMNEIYQQNQTAEKIYNLYQNFIVQSDNVDKITKASNKTVDIINQGVIFSSLNLEYYYSKLPEARIKLLSQAVQDARARAQEMTKNVGRKVAGLKSASSGVVQVQSLNSTDVSDYGSYDTSQIEKQITVTAKATFSLK